mmetsp:Transcript_18161/g.64364  ORF Transcript_18161/g.64364 Transcript_18161/m.64364 type:complete len:384 (+) Transcript_18161:4099-5250(+)
MLAPPHVLSSRRHSSCSVGAGDTSGPAAAASPSSSGGGGGTGEPGASNSPSSLSGDAFAFNPASMVRHTAGSPIDARRLPARSSMLFCSSPVEPPAAASICCSICNRNDCCFSFSPPTRAINWAMVSCLGATATCAPLPSASASAAGAGFGRPPPADTALPRSALAAAALARAMPDAVDARGASTSGCSLAATFSAWIACNTDDVVSPESARSSSTGVRRRLALSGRTVCADLGAWSSTAVASDASAVYANSRTFFGDPTSSATSSSSATGAVALTGPFNMDNCKLCRTTVMSSFPIVFIRSTTSSASRSAGDCRVLRDGERVAAGGLNAPPAPPTASSTSSSSSNDSSPYPSSSSSSSSPPARSSSSSSPSPLPRPSMPVRL